MRRLSSIVLFLLCLLGSSLHAGRARAWVFHEHVEIGRAGIDALNDEEKALLQHLWSAVRMQQNAPRVCTRATGPKAADPHNCVDAPMLPAIAADHSCSPGELLGTLHPGSFLFDVIDVARDSANRMRNAGNEGERQEAWIHSHTQMQRADAQYLGRAVVTGAHFLAPRELPSTLLGYLDHAVSSNTGSNALGLYVLYHLAALEMAAGLGDITDVQHPAPLSAQSLHNDSLARALMAESFAQHFLQDAFASGHTVGSVGNAAIRMGTHDHYCSHGLEVRTWNNPADDQYIAHGDAHMRPQDTTHAARAVRDSWKQFLNAYKVGEPSGLPSELISQITDFNACTSSHMPPGLSKAAAGYRPLLVQVVGQTPQPAVDDPIAAPPRFAKEQGAFLSVYGGAGLDASFFGFAAPTDYGSLSFIQSVGFGIGYDATGILGRTYDSAFWIQVRAMGIGQQIQLEAPFTRDPVVARRTGQELRIRAPYSVIPGDGLFALVLVAFGSDFGISWALEAAQGGYLGLQGISASGFQFVLGREIAVRRVLSGKLNASTRAAEFPDGITSIQLDFPVIDWKPFRTFAEYLALELVFQAGVGLDLNDVGTAGRLFLTLGLNSRYYPGN